MVVPGWDLADDSQAQREGREAGTPAFHLARELSRLEDGG